jgi:uncharacterized protein GlcG (DUF336 family)
MRIVLTLAALVTASGGVAQTPPSAISTPSPPTSSPPPTSPPTLPPTWATRDPLSLPGDPLPPPMASVIGSPPPPNPNMPRPAPPPAPPMALALRAAEAALAKCKADGLAVAVAVSNSAGGMIVGLQADGAFPGRVYNAARKNLVAVEFGTSSLAVRAKLRAGDFATLARVKPNMTPIGGAIPLFVDGKLVGAIAVSGAPAGEADDICAAAGAAVFAKL